MELFKTLDIYHNTNGFNATYYYKNNKLYMIKSISKKFSITSDILNMIKCIEITELFQMTFNNYYNININDHMLQYITFYGR